MEKFETDEYTLQVDKSLLQVLHKDRLVNCGKSLHENIQKLHGLYHPQFLLIDARQISLSNMEKNRKEFMKLSKLVLGLHFKKIAMVINSRLVRIIICIIYRTLNCKSEKFFTSEEEALQWLK